MGYKGTRTFTSTKGDGLVLRMFQLIQDLEKEIKLQEFSL